MEDACDLYGRAANMFKMAKNWSGKDITFSFSINNILTYEEFRCKSL